MFTTWAEIEETEKRTSVKQRQALYRLGYSRWIVHKMTKDQANRAIHSGLELMEDIRAQEGKSTFPPVMK